MVHVYSHVLVSIGTILCLETTCSRRVGRPVTS